MRNRKGGIRRFICWGAELFGRPSNTQGGRPIAESMICSPNWYATQVGRGEELNIVSTQPEIEKSMPFEKLEDIIRPTTSPSLGAGSFCNLSIYHDSSSN